MRRLSARLIGATVAASAAGTLLLSGPAASLAPPAAGIVAATTPTSVSAGERNTKVSRSLTGVRPSAYVGRYYRSRHESVRRCIVRRESGGNYRVVSSSGRYRGAYQFNAALARSTARKMGRPGLVGKPMNRWSRFAQDKAFWIVWNRGRGAGNWPTRHSC